MTQISPCPRPLAPGGRLTPKQCERFIDAALQVSASQLREQIRVTCMRCGRRTDPWWRGLWHWLVCR